MSEQHVLLPEYLTSFVNEQAVAEGLSGADEYVIQLIEAERRKKAQAKLEATLLDRIDSEPKLEMTAADWTAIRREGERRLRESGLL